MSLASRHIVVHNACFLLHMNKHIQHVDTCSTVYSKSTSSQFSQISQLQCKHTRSHFGSSIGGFHHLDACLDGGVCGGGMVCVGLGVGTMVFSQRHLACTLVPFSLLFLPQHFPCIGAYNNNVLHSPSGSVASALEEGSGAGHRTPSPCRAPCGCPVLLLAVLLAGRPCAEYAQGSGPVSAMQVWRRRLLRWPFLPSPR